MKKLLALLLLTGCNLNGPPLAGVCAFPLPLGSVEFKNGYWTSHHDYRISAEVNEMRFEFPAASCILYNAED